MQRPFLKHTKKRLPPNIWQCNLRFEITFRVLENVFSPKTVLLQKQQLGMSGKVCRRLGCDDCSCCSARSTTLQNSSFPSQQLGWKIRLLNTNCSPRTISLAERDSLRREGGDSGGPWSSSQTSKFFLQIEIYPNPRIDFRLFCDAVFTSKPRRSAVSRGFTFQSL